MKRTIINRLTRKPIWRSDRRGFALLEILIAFMVLALGLGALSTGLVVAIRSDGRAIENMNTYVLARSRLEAIGISEALVPGYREGQIAKGYRSRETIRFVEFAGKPSERGGATGPAPWTSGSISAYWVEVSVQADNGAAVSLAALKLGPGRRR